MNPNPKIGIYQEDIVIINVYSANEHGSKYMQS